MKIDSSLTFDSLDSDAPSNDSEDLGTNREEQSPNLSDNLSDEGYIADYKGDKKDKQPEPKQDKKVEETEEAYDEGGDDDEEPFIEFNGQKFSLNEMMSDKEKISSFHQVLKENELRRQDYSRKTQEVADHRKQLEQDQHVFKEEIQRFHSDLNNRFRSNPLLFLQDAFNKDDSGNARTMEEREKYIGDWLKTLTSQVQKGINQDMTQFKEQQRIQEELRQIREERANEEERKLQESRDKEVSNLQSKLEERLMNTLPKETAFGSFLSGEENIYSSAVRNAVLEDFMEAYQAEYIENDPSWDDVRFIQNFNFNKLWEKHEKSFMEMYDKSYDKYLERKKNSSQATRAGKGTSRPARAVEKKDWSFSDIF